MNKLEKWTLAILVVKILKELTQLVSRIWLKLASAYG